MQRGIENQLFLKQQRKPAALLLVFIACFAGSLWLYQLPLEAIVYPSLLCLGLLLLYIATAYHAHVAKYRAMQQHSANLALFTEALPCPTTPEDAIYQTLLHALLHEQRQAADCAAATQRDMTHYYTLWVHQIKTPIAALRLLLQEDDTPHGRSCKQELVRIEQYVEMVLAYLRLNTASTDYLLKPYNLDLLVRQAVRRFSTIFIEKKLQLVYDPAPVTVVTDEKWLLFVIEQLLSNALKYTPNSGVITITISDTCLTIQDNGIGIAPEDLPRVFENGYTGMAGRGDKTASGIGLYLCHTICARLNHRIAITSTQGQGTAVTLDITQYPLAQE